MPFHCAISMCAPCMEGGIGTSMALFFELSLARLVGYGVGLTRPVRTALLCAHCMNIHTSGNMGDLRVRDTHTNTHITAHLASSHGHAWRRRAACKHACLPILASQARVASTRRNTRAGMQERAQLGEFTYAPDATGGTHVAMNMPHIVSLSSAFGHSRIHAKLCGLPRPQETQSCEADQCP